MTTTTRTREITIQRHLTKGWTEFKASASVDVTEDKDGTETFGDVTYTTDLEGVGLTADEKVQLDTALGLPSEEEWDEEEEEADVDEISEEDFEDANPSAEEDDVDENKD